MKYQFDFEALDTDLDRNETQRANTLNAIETLDVHEPGMRERMGASVLQLVRPRGGFALSAYNDRFTFALMLLKSGAIVPPGEEGWNKLLSTKIRLNDTDDGSDDKGCIQIPKAAELALPFAVIQHRLHVSEVAQLLQLFVENGLDPNLTDGRQQGLLLHVCLAYRRKDALEVLLHAGADVNHRCYRGLTVDERLIDAQSGTAPDKQERLQAIAAWRSKQAVAAVLTRAKLAKKQ